MILLFGFFGTAIATYPAGALAAISDPWEAIQSLIERITELERRIGIIERLLGTQPNDTIETPYLATLAPELVGKIEAKYNYQKVYSAEWDEIEEKYKPKKLTDIRYECEIKNLSNQTIRKVKYEVIVKDENGSTLISSEREIFTDKLPGRRILATGEIWIKEALEKAGISLTEDPILTVEIAIKSAKFD